MFLPRLVQLATTSSDRQTKVAACELLHSLVLYMLGRGAQQPGGANKSEEKQPMDALYRKLFPVVMQLACDVEQVLRNMTIVPISISLIDLDFKISLLKSSLYYLLDRYLRTCSSLC